MPRFGIRMQIALSLLVVTPLGFVFKFYPGPGEWWFNNHGAGLLYEIFWILVIFFFLPTRKWAARIPLLVFVITCSLEILQLWRPWFLVRIRSHFVGSALIGTTFAWWDFPHYLLGCILGWIWLQCLIRKDGAA